VKKETAVQTVPTARHIKTARYPTARKRQSPEIQPIANLKSLRVIGMCFFTCKAVISSLSLIVVNYIISQQHRFVQNFSETEDFFIFAIAFFTKV
jgi:hypothetical protein